jgi:queuine tRNA-ribosyltransferase
MTSHGRIETPAFMPVGSLGAVKGIESQDLEACGFPIILCNAYHLYLRPGHETVKALGGLHAFMSWPGAVLTDSGGFQVFSLSKLCKVVEEGVTFQSHLDGSSHNITPERAIEIQEALGADIIMAFDECVAFPNSRERVLEAVNRTTRWAQRCMRVHQRTDQALFGIVQGGQYSDLRAKSADELVEMQFAGYAIGGLSVGEDKHTMYSILDSVTPRLPENKPRYLMGVGMPEDLVEGVARGVDLFDCVVPTRHGRTGWLFTSFGRVLIKNAQYARDEQPIDSECGCQVCLRYSRAYLHHLFCVKEMLGARLNTLHNLHYFAQLMHEIRNAVSRGSFAQFREEFYRKRNAASIDQDLSLVGNPSQMPLSIEQGRD